MFLDQKEKHIMTNSNAAQSKTPKQPPTPGPEHKLLDVFVGKWNMEGQQHAGVVGPAAKVTAVNTYEWLTGGFYLVHRFEGHVGDSQAACIEIIGYDASTRSYPMYSFYNNGINNEWQARESDGIWTLTGEWQMGGKAVMVRCTNAFSDLGNTMTGKWEMQSDGSNWEPFWDVRATKVK
jgi:hypothetical protein